MEHQERQRRIYIGPKAQVILRPWLERSTDAYCFSPKESAEASLAERRRNRKTPATHSRSKPKRKKPSKVRFGDHYTRHSYRQSIERACKRAGVPPWAPNQLRHSRGTEIRREYGIEAAQVALGHARADVTQIYAEKNLELAKKIALETG